MIKNVRMRAPEIALLNHQHADLKIAEQR